MEFNIHRRKKKYNNNKLLTIFSLETKSRLFCLIECMKYEMEFMDVQRWNFKHDEQYHPRQHKFKKREINKIIFKELFTNLKNE